MAGCIRFGLSGVEEGFGVCSRLRRGVQRQLGIAYRRDYAVQFNTIAAGIGHSGMRPRDLLAQIHTGGAVSPSGIRTGTRAERCATLSLSLQLASGDRWR